MGRWNIVPFPIPHPTSQLLYFAFVGILDSFRRWLDGEEAAGDNSPPRPRSKWEDFMVALAREVETVMQREMFTPPGGPTYIPREYIIFLSADDDADWQGEKREGLERGLHHVLSRRAAELANSQEFQTRNFAVELRTDGTLQRGQYRVQPVWDKQADRTVVKPRVPASVPPVADDESTIVRPRAGRPLFTLEVRREGEANGTLVPCEKPRVTIGRGSKQTTIDIKLEGDLEVSRHHATVELQADRFVVTCEGRNSIFIDAAEVLTGESAQVRPGQKIHICTYVLTPSMASTTEVCR
jgi:hypothetical protein